MDEISVLVVEDEGIVALDLKRELCHLGYRHAGTVSSGKQAIVEAQRTHPDVILMDIRLKGEMDGIQAARAVTARLDIPVIFVTALVDRDTLERAKSVRHYGYIVKPFAPEELESAIETAVEQGWAERAETAQSSEDDIA